MGTYLDSRGNIAMSGLGTTMANRDRLIAQNATPNVGKRGVRFIAGQQVETPPPAPTPTGGGRNVGGGIIGGNTNTGGGRNNFDGPRNETPDTPPNPNCPSGQEKINGVCVPKCPTGPTRNSDGSCSSCPSGQEKFNGTCVPKCPSDEYYRNAKGVCVKWGGPQEGKIDEKGGELTCSSGQEKINGVCVPKCPTGYSRNSSGTCVQNDCPSGQFRNSITGQCEKLTDNIVDECPSGYYRNSNGGCTENNNGNSNSGSTTGGGGGGGSTITYSEEQNTNTTGTEIQGQTKQDTPNSPAPAPQSDCLWTAFGKCWTWGDVAIAAAVTVAIGGGVYYLMTKQG